MTIIRMILHDQVSASLSALHGYNPQEDIVYMPELRAWADQVPHHKKKLVLWFSAMRHFASALQMRGGEVRYLPIEGDHGVLSLTDALQHILHTYEVERIIMTEPSEYDLYQEAQRFAQHHPLTLLPDDRFMATPAFFAEWAKEKKSVLMEFFYRKLRVRYNILMDGDKPLGGKWNYDASNRRPPTTGMVVPEPFKVKADVVTQTVIAMVDAYFPEHFGDVIGFHYAVTAEDASHALADFIEKRLRYFGDYQDAMLDSEVWMYHAHIGLYLNCGLLLPKTCITAAEQAYRQGVAPLNAVEGFIRQILGWREFVRGIYWHKMPSYRTMNYLDAKQPLPHFYWDANTDMRCIKRSVEATKAHAYAHHIQRLMVLGNFALLVGIDPQAVNHWFWVVYADAYEWVELPNVSGMILYADGGYLASKPYAAGGSYIDKMSDYCQHCKYAVREKNGPKACPFNYLYWDFMSRHRDKIGNNPRIAMMMKTYDKMSAEKKQAIREDSARFIRALTD